MIIISEMVEEKEQVCQLVIRSHRIAQSKELDGLNFSRSASSFYCRANFREGFSRISLNSTDSSQRTFRRNERKGWNGTKIPVLIMIISADSF